MICTKTKKWGQWVTKTGRERRQLLKKCYTLNDSQQSDVKINQHNNVQIQKLGARPVSPAFGRWRQEF
jgi:hypothetical protein